MSENIRDSPTFSLNRPNWV